MCSMIHLPTCTYNYMYDCIGIKTLVLMTLLYVYISLYMSVERDWEDIRKMPEYATLMRDFGKLKPTYVLTVNVHTCR